MANAWCNRGLAFALTALFLSGKAYAADPPSSPASSLDANDVKAQAKEHFDKAAALTKEGAWATALPEFLESRRLYPQGWAATAGAARCLEKLQRNDEALDMYEALLREHPDDLSTDVRSTAEKALVDMRDRVGLIDVQGALEGSSIIIDGRYRGIFPAPGPLRVGPGRHEIRTYKEGYDPYGVEVEVRAKAQVTALVRSLSTGGRLKVVEQRGRALDIVVDGTVVGKTPSWEGPLPVGEHVVLLRGSLELDALAKCAPVDDGPPLPGKTTATRAAVDLGTQPVRVPVKLREVTQLALTAEELDTTLEVRPLPFGAIVAIDSVVVGRGLWEGWLRVGEHRIDVMDEGFVTKTRLVTLERGKREVVTIDLDLDRTTPQYQRARIAISASAFGLGALGLGTAVVTTAVGLTKLKAADEAGAQSKTDMNTIAALQKASIAGLVIGSVGAATGAIVLYVMRPDGGKSSPASAASAPGRRGEPSGVIWTAGAGLGGLSLKATF